MQRRRVFDEHAALYAAHRPTYPEALFEALHDDAGLSAGSRVLEVAPGTGQATRPLGMRGYRVSAVELGAQMAEHTRRHVADLLDVTVVTSAFEAWPLPEQPFDAVFCATAWHWLDPSSRLLKARQALRPGGTLAVVWTHCVTGGSDALFDHLARLYAEAGSSGAWAARRREHLLGPSTGELEDCPLFTGVVDHRFPVEVTYDRDDFTGLLRTCSETAALPLPVRDRVLARARHLIDDRRGGRVTARYVFELVLARATDPPA